MIKIVANEQASVRSECEALKPMVDDAVIRKPQWIGALVQASWVDVCLGRYADAIATARLEIELLPMSTDALNGVYQL